MTAKGRGLISRPFQGDSMKHTNLTLYLLVILCASFALFKARWSHAGYAMPAIDPLIAADDYYALRPALRVLEGGQMKTDRPVQLYYTPNAGLSLIHI